MKLKQGELIALHRSRKGLTQKILGEKLFGNLSAPHVKMRKIEAGIQKPTLKELKDIAVALDIDFEDLVNVKSEENKDFIVLKEALDYFPKLRFYLEYINLAAKVKDPELIKLNFGRMDKYIKKIISK